MALVGVALADDAPPRTTVGMSGWIEQLVLPGTELIARPLADARSPIVLRIVASYRHGSDYRYDLEYYGLEPGTFNLADYLVRKDGSSAADLPTIPVEIASVLPAGQIEPNRLAATSLPALGGYRLWMGLGATAWTVGLLAILFARRRRRMAAEAAGGQSVTLADRLRPLVTEAAQGRLSRRGLAELERLLLAFWRRKLNLEDATPAQAIATLRRHPEAGELLRQLDQWLHAPRPDAQADVASLLRPYQNISESETTVGQEARA
jgi:hypothetical protein